MRFLQPTTLAELADCLTQKQGENCHLIAGCTDFLAKRNNQAWEADLLVSLVNLPALKVIALQDGKLSIGAVCTHTQIEEHPLVKRYFPALSQACGNVGSKQIRNRGTIGGSIGNASPAGDMFPVLLTLGARAVLLNGAGVTRREPMEKLALAGDEAILSFELPLPAVNNINSFIKLGDRPKVTIAKINLAVSMELEKGVIRNPMVCLGAVSRYAFPASDAMAVLDGKPLSEELFPVFSQVLSEEIRRSIPTRASMPYKSKAVRGLADTILADLICQAKEKSLI